MDCPAGHSATHDSPTTRVPAGHSGTPTQVDRDPAQTCSGQQQWPAVSAVTSWPPAQRSVVGVVSAAGGAIGGGDVWEGASTGPLGDCGVVVVQGEVDGVGD
jgi:hypothetical protein